jgi:hypothetical protein
VCIIVGLVALCFLGIPIRIDDNESQKRELFKGFLQRFNKTYEGNETEYMKHYNNFKVWEYVKLNSCLCPCVHILYLPCGQSHKSTKYTPLVQYRYIMCFTYSI